MELVTRIKILTETDFISLRVNSLGKDKNLPVILQLCKNSRADCVLGRVWVTQTVCKKNTEFTPATFHLKIYHMSLRLRVKGVGK